MRTRRLAVALVAAPLALSLLAGCGTAPLAAVVPAAAPRPPSAGLRTADPAAMSTVDGVADAIVENVTVPAGGFGRVGRADVTRAVEWLGTYLAQAHGDPRWLCATGAGASPSRRHATSALLRRFAAPGGERLRHRLEPRLAADGGPDCAGADWVAPGVAVGAQQITLQPGRNGDDLRVVYRGRFGYRLVAGDGWERPFSGDYRATYGLAQHGREWRLNSVAASWYSLGPGWPDPLPLPAGYAERATAPELAGAHASSLTHVREAVRATLAAPAATWRVTRDDTRAGGPVALARGDALLRSDDGGTQLHLDQGWTQLTALAGPVAPLPAESVPRSPRWQSVDPARRGVLPHAVDDPSPFVNLAVVGLADAAAPAACPADATAAHAERCYAIRVSMGAAAYADGITARFGWGYLAHGHVWLTMRVGVDAAGRLVHLHRQVDLPHARREPSRLELTATLTGFTAIPPARPARPAAATIAHDATFASPA
ncbi:hypothetical protein SAMN05444365_102396 [Micromonospora pattaloongensis]|uniref:Lipoprotein n=1 Tax=Micromonospora pattaloongensis TaxID=405436 RepID=A0A1H3K7M3_9ACTN|nr:hypothetical protein [Micromonospora pattaloongensis]SDY48192.1 hypothetical protein SAMN05444365_102396 [Micromonospora pattaloongensis]